MPIAAAATTTAVSVSVAVKVAAGTGTFLVLAGSARLRSTVQTPHTVILDRRGTFTATCNHHQNYGQPAIWAPLNHGDTRQLLTQHGNLAFVSCVFIFFPWLGFPLVHFAHFQFFFVFLYSLARFIILHSLDTFSQQDTTINYLG